jgi:hypothetical protein
MTDKSEVFFSMHVPRVQLDPQYTLISPANTSLRLSGHQASGIGILKLDLHEPIGSRPVACAAAIVDLTNQYGAATF